MIRLFFFVLIAVFLTLPVWVGNNRGAVYAGSSPADKPDGKEVFLKHKCDNCHSVSTAGITQKTKSKAPDLVDVTVRHEKPWIRKYIRQNDAHVSCEKVDKSRDGKKHMTKFNGTQEEEDALIDWLDKQRSKK